MTLYLHKTHLLRRNYPIIVLYFQKTHYSVVQVTQKAENMIGLQHYNSDRVRAIAENVTLEWQQLRNHVEERHKLVMASMTWYKYAEQVISIRKLSHKVDIL